MKTILLALSFTGALFAQGQCNLTGTFTAIGRSAIYDNRTTKCNAWTFVSQNNSGFSALSIEVDVAPDNNGSPGSWSAATATSGTNPCTNTDTCSLTFNVANAWWSINLSGTMGTGRITWRLTGINTLVNTAGTTGGGGGGGSTAPLIRQSGAISAGSLTTAISVVNGDYVFVATGTNTALCTVADGTNTYTSIANNNTGGNFGQLVFTKVSATAALTITCSGGGSTIPNIAYLDVIPNQGFAGTVDATATNIAGVNNRGIFATLTTTHANELIISSYAINHGNISLFGVAPTSIGAFSSASDGVGIGFQSLATAGATSIGAGGFGTFSDAVLAAGSLF